MSVAQESESDQLSPAELVAAIKSSYGFTWAELGQALGRSEKMLRKVATGQSSGQAYRQALTELYETGRVTHVPPRRRGKDGQLMPVRAKAGASQKLTVPKDESGTYEPRPRRGQFSSDTQHLPDGNRIHEIDMPKDRRAKGRAAGIQEMRRRIVNVAKGTKYRDKRIKLTAVFDVGDGRGRVVDIGAKGGYLANDIVADVRDQHGGNMSAWIASQIQDRYVNLDSGSAPLVKLTMTTFDAARPKEIRVAQDEAMTRRRNYGNFGKNRWKRR